MPGYLIFDTHQAALDYSEQAGKDRNLAYHRGDPNGTRYLYSVITHPEDGRGAVYVDTPDQVDEEGNIINPLPQKDNLEADGWFPSSEDVMVE